MDAATRWLPLGLGASAALFFALLTPPSFFWLDAAELTAAGVGLGSPHPTGFPLYMMMVRAASLVPLGEIGHRVGVLSALCAGVCVGLVARLVIEAGRSNLAALCGAVIAALAVTSSLLFARHAVVAEVYVPTAAMFAAVLLCLDRAARSSAPRLGLFLALLCGLGLGLHSSFRLLACPAAGLFMLRELRRGARWPLFAPMIACGVGLAVQLYLPVRSAVGSGALDWGHPSELASLTEHVTAQRIRESFAADIASSSPEVVGQNLTDFSRAAFDGLGPAALLLAGLGFIWLVSRRRSRVLAATLGCAATLDFVYAFWINPMGIADGQNGALLAVALAVLAGLGATWFLARTGWAAPFIAVFVALFVAAMPMWQTIDALAPASRSDVPRAVADEAMNQLAPRAIALTQSDSLSAAAIYLSAIEGARPDVSVLVRQHLADARRTRQIAGLPPNAPPTFQSLVSTGRPLAWELGDDRLPSELGARASVPFVALGGGPSLEGGGGQDILASIEKAAELWSRGPSDPVTLRHLASALTNLGRLAFARRDVALAGRLFDAAIAASPTYVSALVNRGVVASVDGDFAAALALTNRALSLEPNRISALINAARYERALGSPRVARRHLERAVSLEPKNERARELLSELGTSP